MKTPAKTPSFPRRALVVKAIYARAEKSFTNSVLIEACDVLSIVDGCATVEVRVGAGLERRHCNLTDLASTPARAVAKLEAHFAALLSRPLLPATAGMTESPAATPST